jgi:PilZ domain-containing protein
VDQSNPITNRRSRRAPVLLNATLDTAYGAVAVKLRNLSEQGALVEADSLPAEGETVHFLRNDLRLQSRIVWVQGRYAGVAFDRPLNREDVLRNVPVSAARPKPKPDFKRPGLACRPLSSYERKMLEIWMATSLLSAPGD